TTGLTQGCPTPGPSQAQVCCSRERAWALLASPPPTGTISRSRPYSPQPSFPPLPKASPTGVASPLRDALRNIAADGVRPDSPLSERRAALRNRKLEAQLEAQGEVLEEPESPKCRKCDELEAKHAEESSKFFKEIEHLRRALTKMLDAAAMHMPAVFLRSLKEQLQLDVRYLTKPEKGEGGPLPPVPVTDIVDQTELIESLRRRIAELEKENGIQKRTIRDLEEELRKAQEALRAAGAPVSSPLRKRQLPASKECQTDPWAPFPQKGPEVVQPGEARVQQVQQVEPVHKPKKKKGPAVEAESSSSEEEVDPVSTKPVKRKVKKEEGEVIRVVDNDAIKRLQAELELLKMKLAAAERELAKMEGLKEEIERLKKLLAERDARIAELEEELRKLKEKPKPTKSEGKKEAKKPTQVVKEEPEKKKEKKYKQDPGPTQRGPTVTASQEVPKEEDAPPPVEVHEEPAEVSSESEEESVEEPPPPKEFEDKCVGNGPGRGLQDEPIVCKGRGLMKQDEELNKTGRCYELNLVEQPKLGLSNSASLATLDLDGSAVRTAGKGARGVGVYSGGSTLLGGVQFASSWGSKSGRVLANTWDAEPYLAQVWEQHPKGHKTPVKRELIKLGAISPQKAWVGAGGYPWDEAERHPQRPGMLICRYEPAIGLLRFDVWLLVRAMVQIRPGSGRQTPEELLRALTGKEGGPSNQRRGLREAVATLCPEPLLPPLCRRQTQIFTEELSNHEARLGRVGWACAHSPTLRKLSPSNPGHELNSILAKLRSTGKEQPSVAAVLGELASRYSWYQGKSQQDAHELLRTLLGALTDELPAPEDQESLQQVVQRSFKGQICEAILCWSCRRISLRHEEFLDLSLDIPPGDDDPGPLGLHGWVMTHAFLISENSDVALSQAGLRHQLRPKPAEDEFENAVIEVQLERVPGRRIALGLDWAEKEEHGRKVLRRIMQGSMVDTWNKRQGPERRLSAGLLLLSVNGKEDQDDIMQALKDDQRLLLRFAPPDAVAARGTADDTNGFRVDLARDSKASWGLQLDRNALEDGLLIVAQVTPDSILDAWNLRCQSTGRRAVIRAGDRILEVNGSEDAEEMSKSLTDSVKRKISLRLERGEAKKASHAQAESSSEQTQDPDSIFDIELQAMAPTASGWGFQLELGQGDVEVKSVLDGSPLSMWNIACRSRGNEQLCVEAGDTLLNAASAQTVATGTQAFKLRRSRERQASVRAMGASAMVAAQPKPSPQLESKRQSMLQAAEACKAALPSALAQVFAAAPQPPAADLADCLRNLGSIEALEEDFAPIYNCVHCTETPRQFACKRAWLKPPLPPVVPVQLKRFHGQQGSYQKSRTRIKTSSTLDLSSLILTDADQRELQPFMASGSTLPVSTQPGSTVYELYAVCAHLGGSMERGHYVAFVNLGPTLDEEAWFLLDDARATACQREDVLLVEA
ncbi:UBP19, partial [Symbiodinium pilosum]